MACFKQIKSLFSYHQLNKRRQNVLVSTNIPPQWRLEKSSDDRKKSDTETVFIRKRVGGNNLHSSLFRYRGWKRCRCNSVRLYTIFLLEQDYRLTVFLTPRSVNLLLRFNQSDRLIMTNMDNYVNRISDKRKFTLNYSSLNVSDELMGEVGSTR